MTDRSTEDASTPEEAEFYREAGWWSRLVDRYPYLAIARDHIVAIVLVVMLVWPTASAFFAMQSNAVQSLQAQMGGMRQDLSDGLAESRSIERKIADQLAESNERLARLEAKAEIANQILTTASQPQVERQFIPYATSPSEEFLGGGELNPVPGFDPVQVTIPVPRSLDERERAIQDLIAFHRGLVNSRDEPKFDEENHDFFVSAKQFVHPDGTINLSLESVVIFK